MNRIKINKYVNIKAQILRWSGLTLCFFLSITSAFSQSYDKVIDNLRAELKTHKFEDEKRVDLFNELSYAYRRSAPTKIDSFAKAAFALATKLDYTKGLAIAHKNLGIAIIKNGGTPEETSEQIQLCIKLAGECKDYYTQAACLNNLALGNRNDLEYALAIKNLLRALEIHKEHFPVDRLRLLLLGNIGKTYVSIGDYENAEKYLDLTIKLAEEHGHVGIIAMYTENLTIIKYKKGKKEEAIQILEIIYLF